MMQRAVVMVLTVVWLAVPALAETWKGRITSINGQEKSFQMTASHPETREILVLPVKAQDGTEMTGVSAFDELAVGDQVEVEATEQEGTWVASSIESGGEGSLDLAEPIDAGSAPVAPDAAGTEGGSAPFSPQDDATLSREGTAAPTGSTGASAGAATAAAERGDPSLE